MAEGVNNPTPGPVDRRDNRPGRDRLDGTRPYRPLRTDEIQMLVARGCAAESWSHVEVADGFDPRRVSGCRLAGRVRIGRLDAADRFVDGVAVPVGVSSSRLIDCDIGDNAVIHDVRMLQNVVVGSGAVVMDVGQLVARPGATFGVGIERDRGERTWIAVANESGGRSILARPGMTPADAALWAGCRSDGPLLRKLGELVDRDVDGEADGIGWVGDGAVVLYARMLRDVRIGPGAVLRGCERLENVTIDSRADEPTEIGTGVELVDGVIGPGSRVIERSTCKRFVLGERCRVTFGARLADTVLGDNSTVSCCEVVHCLIAPGHEQHHNNSFLIATTLLGQSNVAAGATIGSNHNGRKPDGEILAGRGFWPGLCVSLKHNSRFASYVLLVKGSYPAELNVPLPFSLVSDDPAGGRLRLMPAFWWLYNAYALARNRRKYADRDARTVKAQHIEFDPLAPDTAEEMLAARTLLARWVARAHLRAQGLDDAGSDDLETIGADLLAGAAGDLNDLTVLAEGVENSRRPVVVVKAAEGYATYRRMLMLYAVGALVDGDVPPTLDDLAKLAGGRAARWENLGGQLVSAEAADRLRADIRSGQLVSWAAVHERLDELWARYPGDRRAHACGVLCELAGEAELSADAWRAALEEAESAQRELVENARASREKDFENPFRQATYTDRSDMHAVCGRAEDDPVFTQLDEETARFIQRIKAAMKVI